jgi:hypothetical protein
LIARVPVHILGPVGAVQGTLRGGASPRLEARPLQHFKVLPLATTTTAMIPGMPQGFFIPHGGVFSSCPPAFWLVDL